MTSKDDTKHLLSLPSWTKGFNGVLSRSSGTCQNSFVVSAKKKSETRDNERLIAIYIKILLIAFCVNDCINHIFSIYLEKYVYMSLNSTKL